MVMLHGAAENGAGSMPPFARVVLCCAVLFALWARAPDLAAWLSPGGDGRPIGGPDGSALLVNVDGYHYLRQAREWRAGQYGPLDRLRRHPDPPSRTLVPPAPALLPALVAGLTGLSLTQSGALLAPLLGALVLWPALSLCRGFGLPGWARTVGGTVALFCTTHLVRTRAGFWDTDGLNVFFVAAACALALRARTVEGNARRLTLCLVGLNAAIAAWWWDSAPEIMAALCLLPAVLSELLGARSLARAAFGAAACGAALAGLAVVGWLGEPLSSVRSVLAHGAIGGTAGFPGVAGTVAELTPATWVHFANAPPDALFGLAALAGCFWLLHARTAVVAGVLCLPVLLVLLALLLGTRLLIFLPVVAAPGVAAFAVWVHERGTDAVTGAVLACAITLLAVLGYARASLVSSSPTPIAPSFAERLEAAAGVVREGTPDNAVIWSIWDRGHPLMWLTERATIMDGEHMGGELRAYANMPLAHPAPAAAAAMIRFHVGRGAPGQRRLAQALGGPERAFAWQREWMGQPGAGVALNAAFRKRGAVDPPCEDAAACAAWLAPVGERPPYLLTWPEHYISSWGYGAWGESPQPFVSALRRGADAESAHERILHEGTVSAAECVIWGRGRDCGDGAEDLPVLESHHIDSDGAITQQRFDHGVVVADYATSEPPFLLISSLNVANSLLRRLLVAPTEDDLRHFERVASTPAGAILWRVRTSEEVAALASAPATGL